MFERVAGHCRWEPLNETCVYEAPSLSILGVVILSSVVLLFCLVYHKVLEWAFSSAILINRLKEMRRRRRGIPTDPILSLDYDEFKTYETTKRRYMLAARATKLLEFMQPADAFPTESDKFNRADILELKPIDVQEESSMFLLSFSTHKDKRLARDSGAGVALISQYQELPIAKTKFVQVAEKQDLQEIRQRIVKSRKQAKQLESFLREVRVSANSGSADDVAVQVERERRLLQYFLLDLMPSWHRSLLVYLLRLGDIEERPGWQKVLINDTVGKGNLWGRVFPIFLAGFLLANLLLSLIGVYLLGVRLGEKCFNLWLTVVFVSFVELYCFVEPLSAFLTWVVLLRGVVSVKFNALQESLLRRTRFFLKRRGGLLIDGNGGNAHPIQHFLPACRVALLHPEWAVSRFVLSIKDFDVAYLLNESEKKVNPQFGRESGITGTLLSLMYGVIQLPLLVCFAFVPFHVGEFLSDVLSFIMVFAVVGGILILSHFQWIAAVVISGVIIILLLFEVRRCFDTRQWNKNYGVGAIPKSAQSRKMSNDMRKFLSETGEEQYDSPFKRSGSFKNLWAGGVWDEEGTHSNFPVEMSTYEDSWRLPESSPPQMVVVGGPPVGSSEDLELREEMQRRYESVAMSIQQGKLSKPARHASFGSVQSITFDTGEPLWAPPDVGDAVPDSPVQRKPFLNPSMSRSGSFRSPTTDRKVFVEENLFSDIQQADSYAESPAKVVHSDKGVAGPDEWIQSADLTELDMEPRKPPVRSWDNMAWFGRRDSVDTEQERNRNKRSHLYMEETELAKRKKPSPEQGKSPAPYYQRYRLFSNGSKVLQLTRGKREDRRNKEILNLVQSAQSQHEHIYNYPSLEGSLEGIVGHVSSIGSAPQFTASWDGLSPTKLGGSQTRGPLVRQNSPPFLLDAPEDEITPSSPYYYSQRQRRARNIKDKRFSSQDDVAPVAGWSHTSNYGPGPVGAFSDVMDDFDMVEATTSQILNLDDTSPTFALPPRNKSARFTDWEDTLHPNARAPALDILSQVQDESAFQRNGLIGDQGMVETPMNRQLLHSYERPRSGNRRLQQRYARQVSPRASPEMKRDNPFGEGSLRILTNEEMQQRQTPLRQPEDVYLGAQSLYQRMEQDQDTPQK